MGIKDILEGRKTSGDYVTKSIAEALGLEEGESSVSGAMDVIRAKESLSASDFPILFGDTLERILIKAYQETPQVGQALVKSTTVPDFREVKRFQVTGGDGRLDAIEPDGEYPLTDRAEAQYAVSVRKYGKAFAINWESFINDDLNALRDQPERFGRGCRRSEEHFIHSLYANNSTLFQADHGAGDGNLGTAVLAINSLQSAIQTMRTKVDAGGDPIFNTPKFLVVPPQLEVTARNILNASTLWWTQKDANKPTTLTPLPVNNWMPADLQLIVADYLPIVDATHGATAWYLFSDPTFGCALEFAKLRGHESPEVFMKSPNAMRVGGGAASPFDGSFENDGVQYKVRHVWGGATQDWRYCYMSDGTV